MSQSTGNLEGEGSTSLGSLRTGRGLSYWVFTLTAVAFSLFVIWVNTFGFMESIKRNALYLAFTVALIFMYYPIRKKVNPRLQFFPLLLAGAGVVVWLAWGEWFWGSLMMVYGLYGFFGHLPSISGSEKRISPFDWTLVVLGFAVGLYTFIFWEIRQDSGDDPNLYDWTFGVLAILLITEATRRCSGPWLPTISIFFLLYGYFGGSLPEFLDFASHRGMDWKRTIELMYMEDNGIYGLTLSVASTFIFIFVLLGSFLSLCGTAAFFNRLALAISGSKPGGPAKVAVIASATMGTISGSAVANVATTGTFTIPLMKRVGYQPYYAGSVEAAASTGGLIMPPVMGTAAFVMVEYLSTSYVRIMSGAIIPALLYYFAIFLAVHLRAQKEKLDQLDKREIPSFREVLSSDAHLLIPIVMLIVTLFVSGRTALFAGGAGILWSLSIIFAGDRFKRIPLYMMFVAIGLNLLLAFFVPDEFRLKADGDVFIAKIINFVLDDPIYSVTLLTTFVTFEINIWQDGKVFTGALGNTLLVFALALVMIEGNLYWFAIPAATLAWYVMRSHRAFQVAARRIFEVLVLGARASLTVGIACAIVGFIVGVAQSTSLSSLFAQNIVYLSGGVLMIGLFFTKLAAIISSMGLPATAVYIVVITVVIEALKNLGVTDFPAHMFVFYFGILSNVTPPVALASYTASGISGGTPWQVGWTAFRLTLSGFIIPYMFIYQPMLLLEGVVFPDIILVIAGALLTVFAISVAGEGYFFGELTTTKRTLLFTAALFFGFPTLLGPKLTELWGGWETGAAWPATMIGLLLLLLGTGSQWLRRERNSVQIESA